MTKPSLFSVPDAGTVPSVRNILSRSLIALSREEWEAHLDVMSPARHLLRDEVTVALEKYTYNRVGAIFFPYTHPAQRDHFLPHMGLWLNRPFEDPRIQTQIWTHTAFHTFWGWPLPVGTTYEKYTRAAFVGEVLSTMESEYGLFERFPEETEGMFNPAYPSTFEAFRAVGANTMAKAAELALHVQFKEGKYPARVYQNSNYKGGVAITLNRQGAWAEHDTLWAMLNWKHQRTPGLIRAYHTLWSPDRHGTIYERHSEGRDALMRYCNDQPYDDTEHLRSVVKSMLRVVVASASTDERLFGWASHLYAQASEAPLFRLRTIAQDLPGQYDEFVSTHDPMPLWDLATEFRDYRMDWELRLKERVAGWTEAQNLYPPSQPSV